MQISLKWQGFPWRSRKGEEQEKEHAPDYEGIPSAKRRF